METIQHDIGPKVQKNMYIDHVGRKAKVVNLLCTTIINYPRSKTSFPLEDLAPFSISRAIKALMTH